MFAVSPLRAMRSAPTITRSIALRASQLQQRRRLCSVHDAGLRAARTGEPAALQQRTRFIDVDVRMFAGALRGDDHAERRAPAAVAIGPVLQCVRTLPFFGIRSRPASAMAASIAICSSLNRLRFSAHIARREHAVDGPRQVHRGRTRIRARAARRWRTPRRFRWCRRNIATPYAPKIPIAGAPRTASVLIASTISSTVRARLRSSACGIRRWSTYVEVSPSKATAAARSFGWGAMAESLSGLRA